MEKQWTLGIIRVITLEAEAAALHGRLIEKWFPALATKTVCIPGQPEGIHDPETKVLACSKILETARLLGDVDAVAISCADDPGIDILREGLEVPVIGAGSATAALCGWYGSRPGLLGITDSPPEPFAKAFGSDLINLGRPEGVGCTLDLMNEQGRKNVLAHAMKLRAAGADCIALACTGMGTIGIAPVIEREIQLPVVDPVMAEGLMAYYTCVSAGARAL